MGPSVGNTLRLTRSATLTPAQQVSFSRQRANWSTMERRYFTLRVRVIAVAAYSRRGAVQRRLSAESREASMRTRGTTLAAIAQNLRRLAKLVVRPPPAAETCFA